MSQNLANDEDQKLTYTAKEAAPMLGMGINQFRAAVRRGEIPAVQIGTKIRIPRRRFLAFIEGEENA